MSTTFRTLLDATSARHLTADGQEHPFTYCMEHVIPAMTREGKTPEDPKAFCGWWKHEHASARTLHALHLLGATGITRTEIYEGKEYLVVPVVSLMEGVIHAVNAETPEFVPLTTLQKAAATWNGRPVVLGHPVRAGKQCSANSPEILASHGIGTIFNSRVEGAKLLQEAWIEKSKAKKLHPEMYERLATNKSEEVSVGAFVVTDDQAGEFNGKAYKGSWLETIGDHLAFLPGGRGACSIAMGCGTHRAAMRMCADHMEFETLKSDTYKECAACKGTGSLNGNPCDACEGTGELRTASISTSSAGGTHKKAIPAAAKPQLKAASCGCAQATKCGCHTPKEKPMAEKQTRAELIAALVTDRYSGFVDGDEAILEAASDARLEEFRSASDARRTAERAHAKLETDLTNSNARLKIAEERLRTAEQNPTEEEWLAKAPPSVKALLDARKAEEDAIRSSLVSQLKDLGANTEAELKAKSIDELKTLAAYARVEIPDFSGRGMPQDRHAAANTNDYAPPDPYAPYLKALQSKAVN